MKSPTPENKYIYLFFTSAIIGAGLTFGIIIEIIINVFIVGVLF
jgi:hypothetical protein